MKTPTHTAPPVALDRLVLPLDVPWIVVDGDYDSLDIHDAKGGFICSPCGDTLGEVCDRSSLIAAAPELLKRCRELESAHTAGRRHAKSMSAPQNPEAAKTVQTTNLSAVNHERSRRFRCAACGDKCRSSISDRGKRTLCRPCEIGRRHHTVDGGKPYNAAWAWLNLGACTINGVSYSKDRRTGTTYRNQTPLPRP